MSDYIRNLRECYCITPTINTHDGLCDKIQELEAECDKLQIENQRMLSGFLKDKVVEKCNEMNAEISRLKAEVEKANEKLKRIEQYGLPPLEVFHRLEASHDAWKAKAILFRGFIQQWVSEEQIDGENGNCVYCLGDNTHTVGCLWRSAKAALAEYEQGGKCE